MYRRWIVPTWDDEIDAGMVDGAMDGWSLGADPEGRAYLTLSYFP
jgi:hypothetical protein